VLVLAFAWYGLISLVFAPTLRPGFSFWVPMAMGVAWGVLAFLLLRYWSAAESWSDLHRWIAVFAAVIVCMGMGFGGSDAWPRMDVIAKIVMNFAMTIWLAWFGVVIKKRKPAGI
jgi:hypothetical protein